MAAGRYMCEFMLWYLFDIHRAAYAFIGRLLRPSDYSKKKPIYDSSVDLCGIKVIFTSRTSHVVSE